MMSWVEGHLLQSAPYLIVKQIGTGVSGQVYLAEDRFLRRQVVIKIPPPDVRIKRDYDKYVRRFQREGDLLHKIKLIPNVVRLIGFFLEGEMPCLVMEYIEGETLSDYIRSKKYISPDKAVVYFQKLAETLEMLHQQSVIHCDIHPGNIILQESGEIVLIDFGSSNLLHPHTMSVTRTSNDFTPYEQRECKSPQPTLDIYSLAATLYFALTGNRPQPGSNRKMFDAQLIPPKQYCPNLDTRLNKALLRGMALESENRPQSMQEWIDSLPPPKAPPEEGTIEWAILWFQRKLSSPLISLGLLLLGYLPTGIVLGIGSTTGITVIVAVFIAVFIAGSVAEVGDWEIKIELKVSLAWVMAVIVSVAMAMAGYWAGTWSVAVAWAVAWTGFGAGAAFLAGDIFLAGDWLIVLMPIGALLGGAISGYFTSIGIWWGLGWGFLTLGQFTIVNISLFTLINKIPGSWTERETSIEIWRKTGFFSMLGLVLGVGIGWLLKYEGLVKIG
jgi:tRNA A-37 threonylcarbamoyl transferase component Bud32